ncbi:uncharacterized protein BDZ83DRAFT_614043 [Colletotrichum acutatum]|uniref:Uncharacterized protein n=1 Tax=Glomerella acutata TaxID=27357 RepID=A0AAD8UQL0_GLOAC|nr:uncharacterized protein BDZ83DRAFT_614043 [Colletotrichum acutatum]KAK1727057.1 hypothetical protein BDZ83DRAFT_614043 [Colletotrichum acutatum]
MTLILVHNSVYFPSGPLSFIFVLLLSRTDGCGFRFAKLDPRLLTDFWKLRIGLSDRLIGAVGNTTRIPSKDG